MTAKTILKHTLRIAWKDLMELFRNRLGLVLLIVMPLFMMVMVGFIYPSDSAAPTDMPIAFVNQDVGYNGSTVPSQTFYTVLTAINNQTHLMKLSNATSQSEVTESIQRGELDGAIVLSGNFSECLLNGEQGVVQIITDQSNPQMSATVRGILTSIIGEMGTMMAQQTTIYTHPTLNDTQALAMVQPFTASIPTQSATQTSLSSNLPVALVNLDSGYSGSTAPSTAFTATLQAINSQTGLLKLTLTTNVTSAQAAIANGTIYGAIVLPSNFSECLLTGKQGAISILTNTSNPITSATVSGMLTGIVNQIGTLSAQQSVLTVAPSISSSQALAVVQPFTVSAPTVNLQLGSTSTLKVGLVNLDSGYNGSVAMSDAFTAMLEGINNQTKIMKITALTSESAAKDMINAGTLDGAIILPSNFSEVVSTGQQGTVKILADTKNPIQSATVTATLSTIVNQMSTLMAQQTMLLTHPIISDATALAMVQPYVVPTQESSNYFNFIAPGIMAMTVMMSVMTGLPVAISQEKEIGTMDGMMVAPVNRLSILLGKTLAQTGRGLIQGVIILALAIGIFGVTIQGNILLVFALLLLGVFSFVGLGIVITSFTKDQETAQMLMMTLMFPMMFLSGVFFPIQQMPWYMQSISQFLPLTYASDALRKVMVLGAGVPQISNELIILAVFGIVMIAIALPVFRRMMTR
ncbi:MAG: ABC transporter permease [Candidatus Bathyarchaeota archaeon]|nr:ABC transporter permease [Candidatus Bathyarchaeota archaeon]